MERTRKTVGKYSVTVIHADTQNDAITSGDAEMDTRVTHAVQSAISRARVCKKPVASYDKETKRVYVEYDDGRREYVE